MHASAVPARAHARTQAIHPSIQIHTHPHPHIQTTQVIHHPIKLHTLARSIPLPTPLFREHQSITTHPSPPPPTTYSLPSSSTHTYITDDYEPDTTHLRSPLLLVALEHFEDSLTPLFGPLPTSIPDPFPPRHRAIEAATTTTRLLPAPPTEFGHPSHPPLYAFAVISS